MKDYSKMSDFEINKEVAIVLGYKCRKDPSCFDDSEVVSFDRKDKIYRTFNFCGNVSEAWPIIVENHISISAYFNNDGWCADHDSEIFEDDEQNPLRAAMIVFLKMKESKNNE